ncbi:MAG: nitrilase-related carbon-nitrogen hydrolase [Anaerolineaceae bacterium]
MRAGFLQFQPLRRDVTGNIDTIRQLLADQDFDLLVLPELANSGYFYENSSDLAAFSEPADGSGAFLSSLIGLAKEHQACLVSGFSEFTSKGLFNSAIAVNENGILGLYRKIHLYNTEKTLFLSGDLGLPVFLFRNACLGTMICFDWIFPEAARTLSLKGAQVICHPANLVLPYCQAAMITRSLENGVFSITANRIGEEAGMGQSLCFTGASQVLSNKGRVLIQADKTHSSLGIVEMDPREASNKRFTPHNDLFTDRRPGVYEL